VISNQNHKITKMMLRHNILNLQLNNWIN